MNLWAGKAPGTIVQWPNDYQHQSKQFLVDSDGTLRHIPDATTRDNLFGEYHVISDLAQNREVDPSHPIGSTLSSGAHLAWDGTPGDPTYLITNGEKRWIPSPDVLDRFRFSQNVEIEDKATLEVRPDGPDLTTTWQLRPGLLVWNTAYKLYLTDVDGTLLPAPQSGTGESNLFDRTVLNQRGFVTLDLSSFKTGTPLGYDAYLATAAAGDGKIYLVANGQKRLITSPAVFDQFGFDWAKVKTVDGLTLPSANGPDLWGRLGGPRTGSESPTSSVSPSTTQSSTTPSPTVVNASVSATAAIATARPTQAVTPPPGAAHAGCVAHSDGATD
jgi:hypothetical protein